jgi:hypothetical protein
MKKKRKINTRNIRNKTAYVSHGPGLSQPAISQLEQKEAVIQHHLAPCNCTYASKKIAWAVVD